jgi:DNA-binding LytR/AlgR family response regulator
VISIINIAICDDEMLQASSLDHTVSRYFELKGHTYKINKFSSGEQLLSSLQQKYFNIIFLDVEMAGFNGIETARRIRDNHKKSIIIFITAYSDYVFQGYEVQALNYILKPYRSEKISDVLDQALAELSQRQDILFAIEQKSGTHKLNLSDTIYFLSDKRKVCAVSTTNNIEFYDKLDELQKRLPSFFIRIHQRYIINLNFTSAVEGNEVIVNGETLPVSRVYKQRLIISFTRTMLG